MTSGLSSGQEAPTAPARHRLDVDAYHRMAEAGIFRYHERIELIDGDLIDMAPIGQGHAAVVGGLTEALVIACAGRAIVWPQNPVRIGCGCGRTSMPRASGRGRRRCCC